MRQFKTLLQIFRARNNWPIMPGAALCALMLAAPSAAQQRTDDRALRCQDLERQLVSDWQRNNSPQEAVGRIDQQLDQLQRSQALSVATVIQLDTMLTQAASRLAARRRDAALAGRVEAMAGTLAPTGTEAAVTRRAAALQSTLRGIARRLR